MLKLLKNQLALLFLLQFVLASLAFWLWVFLDLLTNTAQFPLALAITRVMAWASVVWMLWSFGLFAWTEHHARRLGVSRKDMVEATEDHHLHAQPSFSRWTCDKFVSQLEQARNNPS